MDIDYFLKLMAEKNASDMFLTSGAPVNIKVEGDLLPLGSPPLPSGMSKKVAYTLMNEALLTPLFNYHYRISAPPGVEGIEVNRRGWFEFTEAWLPAPSP